MKVPIKRAQVGIDHLDNSASIACHVLPDLDMILAASAEEKLFASVNCRRIAVHKSAPERVADCYIFFYITNSLDVVSTVNLSHSVSPEEST